MRVTLSLETALTTYDTKYERGREAPELITKTKLIRLPKQGIACEWILAGKNGSACCAFQRERIFTSGPLRISWP